MTHPAQMPVMEQGKLTKEHIGFRVVANMFSEDIKKPKRYGRIVSFDNEGVTCDFGNGKAKIPYDELDFDYCQDGWMWDVYEDKSQQRAASKRSSDRIERMFSPEKAEKKPRRKRAKPLAENPDSGTIAAADSGESVGPSAIKPAASIF